MVSGIFSGYWWKIQDNLEVDDKFIFSHSPSLSMVGDALHERLVMEIFKLRILITAKVELVFRASVAIILFLE
jgi:hypothetical protein